KHRIFVRRRGWLFFGKPLVAALTVILLGFSAEVLAQSIKFSYVALPAKGVTPLVGKGGGYLLNVVIEGELSYFPLFTATHTPIAGEIQLVHGTGVSASGAILAGADLKIVASSLNRLLGFIYARPEIKSPEQLKGKKLGVSRFGTLSDTGASIFLERFGLKRGTDVAIIQLGGLPEIVTALERD